MIFVQVRDTHSLIYSGAQVCVGGRGLCGLNREVFKI